MINFVDCGTDEAILKSISVDSCSEELIKAMNKQGLVQKDVTVQGKNGKVFTRKQWVKASDVKTSKVSGSSTSKDNGGGSEAKQKAVHQLNNCDVGDILGSVDHMISVGRRENPNNGDWEMTYTLRSTGKDLSYDEAVKVLTEHFSKTSSAQSSGRFKPSDFQFRGGGKQVADFVNSLDKEFGVEKIANGNVGFGTLTLKGGDRVAFGYDDKGAYATWQGQQFRSAEDLAKKVG